jgi:hypothetical protein
MYVSDIDHGVLFSGTYKEADEVCAAFQESSAVEDAITEAQLDEVPTNFFISNLDRKRKLKRGKSNREDGMHITHSFSV